jgi:putative addiction module antidote
MASGGLEAMTTTQVTAVGNAVSIVLPPEIVERLKVVSGDRLCFRETLTGIELQRVDDELIEQLASFDQVMREDDEALRRLAE